jgi:protein-tyrosine-phosphatase
MRVLFVCTANVCRSRTAETLFRELSQWPGGKHEVRSAGVAAAPGARQLTEVDLAWADVVCVMEDRQQAYIAERWASAAGKVRVLGIPDVYLPGDPVLRDLLTTHVLLLLDEAEGA